MAKTQDLPGMETQSIPELTKKAEQYVAKRDARIKLLADELKLKEELITLMAQNVLTTYRDDELTISVEFKTKLKVKIGSEEQEE